MCNGGSIKGIYERPSFEVEVTKETADFSDIIRGVGGCATRIDHVGKGLFQWGSLMKCLSVFLFYAGPFLFRSYLWRIVLAMEVGALFLGDLVRVSSHDVDLLVFSLFRGCLRVLGSLCDFSLGVPDVLSTSLGAMVLFLFWLFLFLGGDRFRFDVKFLWRVEGGTMWGSASGSRGCYRSRGRVVGFFYVGYERGV